MKDNKDDVYKAYEKIANWMDEHRSRELFEKPYLDRVMTEASLRYVKEDPGHGPKIAKMSNLDPNRKISSLSNEEFERYWNVWGAELAGSGNIPC